MPTTRPSSPLRNIRTATRCRKATAMIEVYGKVAADIRDALARAWSDGAANREHSAAYLATWSLKRAEFYGWPKLKSA